MPGSSSRNKEDYSENIKSKEQVEKKLGTHCEEKISKVFPIVH
jgi:hypothetical protein